MSGGKSKDSWAHWRRWYANRRFRILAVIVVALSAAPQALAGFGVSRQWFDRLMALLLVAVIFSLCFARRQRVFALAMGIPTVALSLGGYVLPDAAGDRVVLAAHLGQVLFLLGAAVLTIRTLISSESLSLDSVFGALCGYLFLGLGWALTYDMIESLAPGSFAISEPLRAANPGDHVPHVLTYYSFATLTTVGYGDVTPLTPLARTLAWLEAVVGQFYLAVIVAGLVSMFVARKHAASER